LCTIIPIIAVFSVMINSQFSPTREAEMISPQKIDEWIHEVEERPASAPLILRLISARLQDLTRINADLNAENISLRNEHRVEEYESRIAALEYQVNILKRQLGGIDPVALPQTEALSLLVYHPNGQVIRLTPPASSYVPGAVLARFNPGADPGTLLAVDSKEELLFVMDTGRTIKLAVSDIPLLPSETLDWQQAHALDRKVGEELVAILPIGRMTLYDYCIQASRRGCAKKMMKTSFEGHLAKNYIGSGVKLKSDRTACLTFSNRDDCLVLATLEGFLLTMDVSLLAYTVEETIQLSSTDCIMSAFGLGGKTSLLILTQNGKVLQRETSWLEKAVSFRSRGQPVFSQSRRDAGIRLVGAAAMDENDWVLLLDTTGQLSVHPAAGLIASGAVPTTGPAPDLVSFATFKPPAQDGPQ
jgi:DNA gyrase/topoisomerase IV subunit A